jgi:iron complex transport system substrate-binding protein
MSQRARRTALTLVPVLAVSVLAACSTGSTTAEDAPAPKSESEVDADAFPVTIETSFGETTIEEEPERVVALTSDADVALSLGVVPIAIERNDWAGGENGTTEWWDQALADVEGAEEPQLLDTADGIPVDEIVALEPDVVLGTNSGLTKDDVRSLEKAGVPVVGYPGLQWGTTWQESLDMVGQALGRNELADEVEADTQQVFADAREEYPELEGTSFLFSWFDATDLSQIGIYTEIDNRPRILSELGMVNPPVVEDGPDDTFYFNVSLEKAKTLEADVVLTYATSDKEAEKLEQAPLVSDIPAVQDGNFLASVDPADTAGLSAPSPIAIPFVLDRYLPQLAETIDG